MKFTPNGQVDSPLHKPVIHRWRSIINMGLIYEKSKKPRQPIRMCKASVSILRTHNEGSECGCCLKRQD